MRRWGWSGNVEDARRERGTKTERLGEEDKEWCWGMRRQSTCRAKRARARHGIHVLSISWSLSYWSWRSSVSTFVSLPFLAPFGGSFMMLAVWHLLPSHPSYASDMKDPNPKFSKPNYSLCSFVDCSSCLVEVYTCWAKTLKQTATPVASSNSPSPLPLPLKVNNVAFSLERRLGKKEIKFER